MSTHAMTHARKAKAGSRKAPSRPAKTNARLKSQPPGPNAFMAVVKAFANDPEVTPPGAGKGFGSRALKVKGKIFAMISSKSEFVVKLPTARAAELVTAGQAKYFDAGRGKAMKEWAAITGGERLWLPLAKQSRAFVGAET